MMSEITDHLHPILVHFPIAMITISLLYDLFIVWKKKHLPPTNGLWLWIISAVSAALSVATGPDELARGNTIFIETHSRLGNITMWFTFIVVAYRLWNWYKQKEFQSFPLVLYLLISIVTCICVLVTGYYGGKMVYDQGVGVKKNGAYVNPPVHRPHHDNHD